MRRLIEFLAEMFGLPKSAVELDVGRVVAQQGLSAAGNDDGAGDGAVLAQRTVVNSDRFSGEPLSSPTGSAAPPQMPASRSAM